MSRGDAEFFADDTAIWWEQHKQDEEQMWLATHEEWVQLEFDFEFAPLPLHLQTGSLCHFA